METLNETAVAMREVNMIATMPIEKLAKKRQRVHHRSAERCVNRSFYTSYFSPFWEDVTCKSCLKEKK